MQNNISLLDCKVTRMRVLVVTNLYPNPFQPQRAVFNRRQLRSLSAAHPVRVIAPIAWTDEVRGRRCHGALLAEHRQVTLDGITVDHPRVYYVPGMMRSMYGRCYYWSIRKVFRRICREFRPSIVYAPWIYPDGWAVTQLATEGSLPVVLKAHGSDVLLLDRHAGRLAGTIEALKSAQGIVAVSQDLARRMISLGANGRSIRVIYDGLERHLFSPGSKSESRRRLGISATDKMLLFVGNLVPVKGLDTLLEAVAILRHQGQPTHLHVIGDGPLRHKLAAISKCIGIEHNIQWHGSLPQTQLPEWYRAADVFVLPSRSEGVPNVLLEASACGTPWVATRVGGIPEIAFMGASRLVAADQANALADAIRTTLASPSACGAGPSGLEEMIEELSAYFAHVQEQYAASRSHA